MDTFYFIIIASTFILIRNTGAVEKYKYTGCYEDNEKSKILNEYIPSKDPSLTIRKCVDICYSNKFIYATLENNRCRCGNFQPPEVARRNDIECYPLYPSSVDGKFKVSIYETAIISTGENAIPAKIYLGCYIDDNPEFRVLKGSNAEFPDNTPAKCHKHCYKQGFKYFGLTYIKECFCGDTVPSKDAAISDTECNTRCGGDEKEFCGGGWRLSIYATGITDIPENDRFVGCFKNSNGNAVKEEAMNLTRSNSNRRCLNICDQKGFKYSGVQNGTQCTCMNEIPKESFREDEYFCDVDICPGEITEKCGSQDKIKIFKTRNAGSIEVTDSKYLGCYKDQLNFRTFEENKEVFENNLTPKICVDTCKLKGFAFSGVESGKECYCSHKFPSMYAKTDDEECIIPCPGKATDFCGGSLRLAVYDNGLPHPRAYVQKWYEGCFKDDNKDDRILKGSWQELANNSPNICHKLCTNKGYMYFGLTYIKECFCGDETPSQNLTVPESECQTPCGGDSTKKCGGGWRLSVYRTGLREVHVEKNYTGCFKNDRSLLTEWKLELPASLNPKRCQNICDMLGFLYAGLERGVECRCGYNLTSNLSVEDDAKCAIKCPGDSSKTCGDINYVKIYRTSVASAS